MGLAWTSLGRGNRLDYTSELGQVGMLIARISFEGMGWKEKISARKDGWNCEVFGDRCANLMQWKLPVFMIVILMRNPSKQGYSLK